MGKLTQRILKKLVYYSETKGKFYRRRDRRVLGSPESSGYLTVQLGRKVYSLHRLAWLYVYGKFPERVIDHIDHNKHNNRLNNLREITQAENCKNRKLSKNNTSGVTGVFWNKRTRKWIANIRVDKKNISLGSFGSLEEAVARRQEANEFYKFHENHGKPLDNN